MLDELMIDQQHAHTFRPQETALWGSSEKRPPSGEGCLVSTAALLAESVYVIKICVYEYMHVCVSVSSEDQCLGMSLTLLAESA